MNDMAQHCAFRSPRTGIACQLTRGCHPAFGFHMAWLPSGRPILKLAGDFVVGSPN